MRALLLIPALFALAACAGEAAMTPADSNTDTAGLDALMHDYTGKVPGAAVLVLRDGAPVVRRVYGLADVEAGTPVTPQTNFRLASVSKQFTAAAILLLVQDGRLSLSDPVRKWFPSLPAVADPITVEHLLTHTSGLIDYEDLMADDVTGQVHDIDVLHLLEQQPRLYFTPGADYRYSNGAYALLALLVHKASGQDFASFLHARIFKPLGMNDTVAFEDGISTVPHRAYGHSLEDGQWKRTDQSSTSAVLGDGGIYSSLDDLAKWDAALYDDRLLKDDLRQRAFTSHVRTHDPEGHGYGYGWFVDDDALWHTGSTIGFRNILIRKPQQRLTVVVLTNRSAPDPHPLALEIAKRYAPR